MLNICRVCLTTKEPLRHLEVDLTDCFQDLCDYTSGFSKHMCCPDCEVLLKINLDFKNKCRKANQIWKLWHNKKGLKEPIESLHGALQAHLKRRNIHLPTCVTTNDQEITKNGKETKNNDKVNDNGKNNEIDELIEYVIKEEANESDTDVLENDGSVEDNGNSDTVNGVEENNDRNDVLLDDNKDDVINDIIEHEIKEEANESDTDVLENDGLAEDNGNSDDDNGKSDTVNGVEENYDSFLCDDSFFYDENNLSDDEDPLMDSAEKTNVNSKGKLLKKKVRWIRPRQGLSYYSRFTSVFDIQLFGTDDEAKKELEQRKVSEPYLSAEHRCEVCYTVYSSDKLLTYHMKWHQPSSFECDICHMTFNSHRTLRFHNTSTHRGKFSCKLCPLVTYYKGAMRQHFEKHDGKKYPCFCGRVFNHRSSYLTHRRAMHGSEHVCVACARTFVSATGLVAHKARAHRDDTPASEESTVRCEPCNLTFVNQMVYNIHVLNTLIHVDVAKDIIACKYCGLPFPDTPQLKAHKCLAPQRIINNLLRCKLCDALGEGRGWRRQHYLSEHPTVPFSEVIDGERHLCQYCGKHFASVKTLKDHINIHSGAKPYKCAQCPRTFNAYIKLRFHMDMHAPPRRQCPHCGNKFRSANNLNRHMRIHTSTKKYTHKCPHCDNKYRNASNLSAHMRTHTGTKKYICSICSKEFSNKSTCQEHERSVHRNVLRPRKRNKTTGRETRIKVGETS